MNDLALAVRTLAERRQHEALAKEMLSEIEAEVAEKFGASLAAARRYLQDTKSDEVDAAAKVRQLGIDQYGDADKPPHPAVGIGMYTVLKYDESDAIDHCRKHLPNALSLKKKDFEAVAKVAKLKFVSITTEPRAKIARDLSRWLPGVEGDDGD